MGTADVDCLPRSAKNEQIAIVVVIPAQSPFHFQEREKKQMKRADIIEGFRRKTTRTELKALRCREMVQAVLGRLLPVVKEYEASVKAYNESMSVTMGSRMQDARQLLKSSIEAASEEIKEAFNTWFSDCVTIDELEKMIMDELRRIHPQGENGRFFLGSFKREVK